MTTQQFVRAGDMWHERSTTAGPEYLPCPNCGAEWNPVFVAFKRSHPLDCAYVADIMKHSEITTLLEQYAASLPNPEDALPDEELEGYVLGVRDALKILRGEGPDRLGRDDLT